MKYTKLNLKFLSIYLKGIENSIVFSDLNINELDPNDLDDVETFELLV